MVELNLHIFAAPCESARQIDEGAEVSFAGRTLQTWTFGDVDRNFMSPSFEQVAAQLSALPRLYFEPDGSLVWRGESLSEGRLVLWQIDGIVYDAYGRVVRIELKGNCGRQPLERLLSCIQPTRTLVAYLVDCQRFVMVEDLIEALPI